MLPTDPLELVLFSQVGEVSSRVPATLAGVRPRPFCSPQLSPQLLTVWHVVPEEEVITRGVPFMIVKHGHPKVTGDTSQLITRPL